MPARTVKPIAGAQFLSALRSAGVIGDDDLVRRVVIDADMDNVVQVYVERVGDERLLSVATTLKGVEIREAIEIREITPPVYRPE